MSDDGFPENLETERAICDPTDWGEGPERRVWPESLPASRSAWELEDVTEYRGPACLDRPLTALGDFRLLREIGRGGIGVVYEAEQVSLGRRVAVKVLSQSAAIEPKLRRRFQIEAQAEAALQHPHIVPVIASG